MVDPEAVRTHLPKEEPRALEGGGGAVDGRGVHLGLPEREAKLGQMRHLVHLSAGRLEEDRGSHPPVDVPKRPGRVRIQRPGVRRRPGQIGLDCRVEPRFP